MYVVVVVVVVVVAAAVTLCWLFLQRVVAADADTYQCYAFNKFGSNSANGQLVVLSTTFTVFRLLTM